jgi:hypothetical protein
VGFADDLLDLLPARAGVEADADPAAHAHVGRDEKAFRVLADENLLDAQRHGQPHTHVGGAVVVVVEGGEHAAAHPERRLAVRDLLAGAGQRPTDTAQALERRHYVVT